VRLMIFVVLGLALLAAGFYMQFAGSGVIAADRQRCQETVQNLYANSAETRNLLLSRCGEPGVVAMMDARANHMGAEEAAQSVGTANRGSIFCDLISYALIGGGIGAIGAACAPIVRGKKRAKA